MLHINIDIYRSCQCARLTNQLQASKNNNIVMVIKAAEKGWDWVEKGTNEQPKNETSSLGTMGEN